MAMSLRDRLRESGLLDDVEHTGFRLVTATCARCETPQNLLVAVGTVARCILCDAVLGGAPGVG